jgi:hypothetical protein
VLDASRDPRLLHQWAELEREALEPNPFFAQQLVLPAARHLGAGTSVALLIAESGARLMFLLPVVQLRPGFGGVAVSQLRSWVHDYCYLGTPLLSRHDDPDRIWTAVPPRGYYQLYRATEEIALWRRLWELVGARRRDRYVRRRA